MANILYGQSGNLYGNTNNKYGVPVTTWTGIRWAIEVDWDGDGVYDGSNETIYCTGLSTQRGFNELYDVGDNGYFDGLAPVDTGTASITLDNETKRFSAWYTSGALYGKLYPGKNIRIWMREDYTGTNRDVFTGYIDDLSENRDNRTVRLECKDGVEILKASEASIPFAPPILPFNNITSRINTLEGFIEDILYSIDWQWSYDVSKFPVYNYPLYYLVCKRRAYTEFKEIARVNRGGDGVFYVNASGNVVFDMLQDFGLTPTTYDASIFGKSIQVSQPWKNVISTVKAKVSRWLAKDEATVWDHGQPPLKVAAGESVTLFASYTFNSTDVLVMVDAITPVSGTDLIANSAEDGTGSVITGNFTFDFTNLGVTGMLTITNTGGSDGFFTTLKIRGIPYVISITTKDISTEKSNVYSYGQKSLVAGSQWSQIQTNDVFWINSFAFWYTGYAEFSKKVTVTLRARSQQFLHEINDLISFNISDPDLQEYIVGFTPYYGVYANRFRIMSIKHRWLSESGQDVETTWVLRHILFY